MFAAHILRCLNGSASPQCAGVTCCRKWDFISGVFLCLVWSIQIHEAGLKYNAVSVWRYHKNKKMQQVCLWYSGHIIYTVRYTVYMIIYMLSKTYLYRHNFIHWESERERENKKNMCLLFAFSWEWSLLAMFFFVSTTIRLDICSKVSPRKGGLVWGWNKLDQKKDAMSGSTNMVSTKNTASPIHRFLQNLIHYSSTFYKNSI